MDICKTILTTLCCISVFILSAGLSHAGETDKYEKIEYYIDIDNPPAFISEYKLKSTPFLNNVYEKRTTTSISINGYIVFSNKNSKLISIKEIMEYAMIKNIELDETYCDYTYEKIHLKKNRIHDEGGRRKQEISFLQYRDAFGECEGPLIFEFAVGKEEVAVEAYLRRGKVVKEKD